MKRRYRVEFKAWVDGVLEGKSKEDKVVLLIWAYNDKQARDIAEKVSKSLCIATHMGPIEYPIKSIKLYRGAAL